MEQLFARKETTKQSETLSRVLFEWEYADFFTVGNSLQSALILGETGSAKTTSSGAMLAGHYLRNGYGMLFTTCKEDELERIRKYCKAYGREKDLVIFSPDSGEHFNWLEEEISRQDKGKGIAHNIADVLKTIIKAGHSDGQESDKAFWDSSLSQLLDNAVDLMLLTGNKKFEHIYQIIQSAPRSKEQLNDAKWLESSKCCILMKHIASSLKSQEKTRETDKLAMRLNRIEDFFYESWINLSPRTRSIVEQMFFSFGSRFMSDPLYSLFKGETTVRPEDTIKGKIIVLDLPLMIYDKIGRDCQLLWKFLWMRSMQRRVIDKLSRPCVLFIDEFQYFVDIKKDVQFQSTCRSYRACTVYITQNLPNFYIQCGGSERGKIRFKALAGNISTKFFHANSDPETNEFASEIIGKDWQWSANEGQTLGENISFSSGQSETLQYIVDPSVFTKLKTGGADNNFEAEAIVHRQGKIFNSTQSNYKLVTIKQTLL